MAHAHGLGLAAFLSALVLAPPAAAEQAGGAADPLSPANLLNGPSLHETGRIAGMPQPLPPATKPIAPVPAVNDSGEKSIRRVAATVEAHPPPRRGTIDAATLNDEIAARFAAL